MISHNAWVTSDTGPGRTKTPGRLVPALLLASLAAATLTAMPTVAQASPPQSSQTFGPNVTVFDPSMSVASIKAAMKSVSDVQTDDEMGTGRHTFLFKPGTYGTDEEPLQVKVGYNTEVAGLGASPTDVTINGKVEVYNRCLRDEATTYCVALNNFWRTLSNLTIKVNAKGQDGCRDNTNFWSVSQAVSMRRVNITGGQLTLMDYCSAPPNYASGGFIADSQLPLVINGSQQQWYMRNSSVTTWTNAVWNQVFSGVEGAPDDSAFPTPPYTTLETTPLSREKPFLYLGAHGTYQVRVPSASTNTSGVSWADGMTPGRSLPLTDFFVAKPSDSIRTINDQLARGKNLLLTPGIYNVSQSLEIKRANTVVLGMGQANLTSVRGATPVKIADVPGVVVAGITVDAGTTNSAALMEVGKKNGHHSKHASDPTNPTTLSDVYFRVGGPHIGKTTAGLIVNSNNVLIDHTWVWRADHGVENFTAGVSGDTDRWNTNTSKNGVIVNGDNVTATGFFVEHFQEHNVVWNGNGGTVLLFQSELAYDAPTQADWMEPDGTLGWASYKVSNRVKTHHLYGGGAYVYQRNDPTIHTTNGFEVPKVPGVKLHHILTVNLDGGVLDHVVNGIGDAADMTKVGQPVFIADYPTP